MNGKVAKKINKEVGKMMKQAEIEVWSNIFNLPLAKRLKLAYVVLFRPKSFISEVGIG